MAILVALAGLSGAGKTTAADYFRNAGLAEKVYIGEEVLNEVRTRGLKGPDAERAVRIELRERYGPAIFAIRASLGIKACLDRGLNVVVDAVFHSEEYRCLQGCCSEESSCVLLAIEASFEVRSPRLIARRERPCTPEELKDRDDVERQRLETDTVIGTAQHRIVNERSMEVFENDLIAFWRNVN